jgi:hypothetical protein
MGMVCVPRAGFGISGEEELLELDIPHFNYKNIIPI